MNIQNPTQFYYKNKQTGAVLAISLVLLLVMTLIGLTGMRVTSLEERMAGNMKDRNMAFQAAESALRVAESTLTIAVLPAFSNTGTNGLYSRTSISPVLANLTDATTWNAANTTAYNGGNLADISAVPEFIIQEMAIVSGGGESLDGSTFTTSNFYRVTARGTGGTTSAVAIVQSVYRR